MASGSVFGATASGQRLERMRASPRFVDGAFRNTAPISLGLKPGTTLSTIREYVAGGQRRTPPGPLPSVSPLARFGPFELVMLEVGAWHPAWGDVHLGPLNALRATELLGGGRLLPVHWGTFNLGMHAWDEPVETLAAHAGEGRVRLVVPRLGAPVEPARVEAVAPWWREVSGAPVAADAVAKVG